MKDFINLFFTFAKVGAMTFGGGYAMLPILRREVVEAKNWATDQELADYFAIGQCTPGIIAVNTATFIGYRQKGLLGAVAATCGLVLPSLVIICLVAAGLRNFQEYPAVVHAFAGIRACVCVLIINAVIKLCKSSIVDMPSAVLFVLAFVVAAVLGLSPAIIVVCCGLLGLVIKTVKRR